jgi:predicted nicotinamide N-methyase
MTPEALVRSGTSWAAVPFVPEIRLLTAAEPFGLWDRTEQDAPPFWAFPWAGGQALARYVLDHPGTVHGRRVLDAASGSGLVAIAAAKAGAAGVIAGDLDPNAVTAIEINARANAATTVTARAFDLAADDGGFASAHVVLAADVFYQRELADMALRFLRRAADNGEDVLVADPGRAFLPAEYLTALTSYQVPVLTVLEDTTVKTVTVYGLALRPFSMITKTSCTYTMRIFRDHGPAGRRSGSGRRHRRRARLGWVFWV